MFVTYNLLFFRERVCAPKEENTNQSNDSEKQTTESVARTTLQSQPRTHQCEGSENSNMEAQNGYNKPNYSARSLLKSASISASKCVEVKGRRNKEVS